MQNAVDDHQVGGEICLIETVVAIERLPKWGLRGCEQEETHGIASKYKSDERGTEDATMVEDDEAFAMVEGWNLWIVVKAV
jgi:hypothetical protein